MSNIHYEIDGTVTLTSDDGFTQVVEAGQDVDAAALAFFGPPPVVRRTIRKSTVMARVNDAGLFDAVMDLLDARENRYAKSRWFSPDWPEVNSDDPQMLGLLAAAGADEATITTITAPE